MVLSDCAVTNGHVHVGHAADAAPSFARMQIIDDEKQFTYVNRLCVPNSALMGVARVEKDRN